MEVTNAHDLTILLGEFFWFSQHYLMALVHAELFLTYAGEGLLQLLTILQLKFGQSDLHAPLLWKTSVQV